MRVGGVPGHDVDRASLAVVVEAPLRDDLPAGGDQVAQRPLDDAGVGCVEQVRTVAAAPPGIERDPDLQDVADLAQRADGHRIESTELDLGDPALAAADALAQVTLAPAVPQPNGPDQCGRRVRPAWPDHRTRALTWRSPGLGMADARSGFSCLARRRSTRPWRAIRHRTATSRRTELVLLRIRRGDLCRPWRRPSSCRIEVDVLYDEDRALPGTCDAGIAGQS